MGFVISNGMIALSGYPDCDPADEKKAYYEYGTERCKKIQNNDRF